MFNCVCVWCTCLNLVILCVCLQVIYLEDFMISVCSLFNVCQLTLSRQTNLSILRAFCANVVVASDSARFGIGSNWMGLVRIGSVWIESNDSLSLSICFAFYRRALLTHCAETVQRMSVGRLVARAASLGEGEQRFAAPMGITRGRSEVLGLQTILITHNALPSSVCYVVRAAMPLLSLSF